MSTPNAGNCPDCSHSGSPPEPFDQHPYFDHILRRKTDGVLVKVRFFQRDDHSFWMFGNSHTMTAAEMSKRFDYVTPVLTSAQIPEMLEAEGERAARLIKAYCEKMKAMPYKYRKELVRHLPLGSQEVRDEPQG